MRCIPEVIAWGGIARYGRGASLGKGLFMPAADGLIAGSP